MFDLPAEGLFEQLTAHPLAAEHLEVLGKHAASLWQSGQGTLTQAVVEAVKHAGLGPEQVRRVVEFANTDAYLSEFRKEGAGHRVVDFGAGGPADPAEVLRTLNTGAGAAVHDRGTLDYTQPPPEAKTASPATLQALEQLFGQRAPGLPFAEPFAEAVALRDKLAAASDHLTAELSGLEVAYADLADRVYQQVKQAALHDVPLGDVLDAIETAAPSADYIKVAFELFAPRLTREGVFRSESALLSSVEKTAAARTGLVNQGHPLLTDFREYCDVLQKLAELREAREDVRESLGQLTAFFKEAAAGAYHSVKQVAQHAGAVGGDAARWATNALFGHPEAAEQAGKVVKGVLNYTPEIGLAVGANELRRHAQYSPTAQRVMQYVPGTTPYNQRTYEIAGGQ